MEAFAQDFSSVVDALQRVTVQVHTRGGHASGVLWRPDLVITNAHVARGPQAEIETWNGHTVQAEVTSRDDRRDLAALGIAPHDLAVARVRTTPLRVGELVFAVGHPLGVSGALSAGIVHALDRDWVRADIRLLPGNSGGPLADASGRVIGINSMVSGGLGLAVPSEAVMRFLQPRPQLGVVLQPVVTPRGSGLLVLEVTPGSAAETAGLLPGDILLGANGRAFAGPRDVIAVLDRAESDITLLRGGRQETRSIRIGTKAA